MARGKATCRGKDGLTLTFQRLVGEIFRFNGALLDVAADLSRDLGINPSHWQVVAIIRDVPMTVSDISRCMGLRRQSVQHTVDQLHDMRLVEFVTNPRHRRAQLVRLTARGRNLMAKLYARQAAITRRFTAGLGLGPEDLESLISALRRMQDVARAGG